jgi:hypothetical protein
MGVAHEIDTWAFGQLAEKIPAQPLNQRLRIRKEKATLVSPRRIVCYQSLTQDFRGFERVGADFLRQFTSVSDVSLSTFAIQHFL